MHLVEKEIVREEEGQPPRVKRRRDKAQTPFDRLCDADAILPAHKEELEALRDSINPRRLRLETYDDIDAIFQLPCAQPDSTQDVYLTLAKNSDNRKESLSKLASSRTHVKPQARSGTRRDGGQHL